ncbi:molybdopterin oxidoreductase [Novosphingobium marinum]|uniref:DMSO/TMAO reductase YedYZ molybdopterin-dependent catalytic subunit n=1 Tax=Novosphingobium marinum TaxID=1514948 RepID=A0A7Y9XUZ6_9SPHN|nr:molybdopterin-dependent oxidoreductase [Novosphingobium marinum]NYH94967.1 DMSO/TMAO reductase YedYZ molybdopterin-dependent catalytic subunit [Novosphingobium marinum]GGC41222.1 molybdopterin oxidoreductase [Novosphingobium marinum]
MKRHELVLSRRKLLGAGALGAGGLLLSGCDRLNSSPGFRSLLSNAEDMHMGSQRLFNRNALAREYTEADMSPRFRANGNRGVTDAAYRQAFAGDFADWALVVDGAVSRPLQLPLAALQSMPQREQITRHDCVEGWSAIGKWQGPQLGRVLEMAGLLPSARYIVFHCADSFGSTPYYESIDLVDAFHPQTILAWRMNGQMLPEEHGAPVRARIERQLGYKHAKFVMRIEAREGISGLYGGKGGYWEDASDYAWYAGI